MSRNLVLNDSDKDRRDELKRRINTLTERVKLALETLKAPLLPVADDTPPTPPPPSRPPPPPPPPPSRAPPPPPPPSRTPPPPPPIALYPPFSPPPHPPRNIPLPPLPVFAVPSSDELYANPSFYFPKPPSHKPPPPTPSGPSGSTARCIEAGNKAAGIIDALPPGYRRIALIAFDKRYPPIDRIELTHSLPGQVVRGRSRSTAPIRNKIRWGKPLPVVPEE